MGGCLLSLFGVVSDRCNGAIHGETPVGDEKKLCIELTNSFREMKGKCLYTVFRFKITIGTGNKKKWSSIFSGEENFKNDGDYARYFHAFALPSVKIMLFHDFYANRQPVLFYTNFLTEEECRFFIFLSFLDQYDSLKY